MEKHINLEETVAGCLRSETRQQEALYKYCYPIMLKICLRYAADRDEAAALYNAAMLKVFNGIQAYQTEGRLLSWIRTIIINTSIDHVRQKSPIRLHELEETYNDAAYVEASVFQDISAREILQLMQQLPATTRMVFNLFAIEGYTHDQISKMLQIPAGTSRWYTSEARRLLREKMETTLGTIVIMDFIISKTLY